MKEEFNIQNSYGYHINVIFSDIKRFMDSRLKEYELTHLQFGILMNLYKNNLSTQKELLKYTYGDEASITRLIDRLELKGYLTRVACTKDKRKKKIVLTDEGVSLTKKLIPYAKEINKEIIKDLDKNEADELLRLLKKVHIAIE